jgi:hypothetical protein
MRTHLDVSRAFTPGEAQPKALHRSIGREARIVCNECGAQGRLVVSANLARVPHEMELARDVAMEIWRTAMG